MVADMWNKYPKQWQQLSLAERLECLRIFYCTGPWHGTRSALDESLREAIQFLYAQEFGDEID